MKRCKQDIQRATRAGLAVLTLLVALASGVGALPDDFPQKGWTKQPDGTILHYVYQGDKRFVDGYVVVYGSGGWWYYAELDVRGEYVASPYKVGIDDPAEIGIPRDLQRQRSAVHQAEIDATNITTYGTGHYLKQPDGTGFIAYWDAPLPTGSFGWCTSFFRGRPAVPADGYVIAIFLDYEEDSSGYSVCVNCDAIPIDVRIGDPASERLYYVINYGDGEPFWAFVYDEESGWYYYAERLDPYREYEEGYAVNQQGYILDAQGEYVASPYKVGIDLPPGYNPPTAIQESSWGAVKHLFHK